MLAKCVLTVLELNWNKRLGHKKTELNICHHMLTSSTQLPNRSFHVVERTRTSSKCQKMKYARAKRAKILFSIVKYANLWVFLLPLSSWLLKLPIISIEMTTATSTPPTNALIGWIRKKKIVLHVRHAFWFKFLTQSAKRRRGIFIFEVLTTTRTCSSKSFMFLLFHDNCSCQQAKVHLAHFVQLWPIWNNRKTLNLTQSYFNLRILLKLPS